MPELQTLSDQQNTSISTKMVWYGLGESQASLLLPSIPAPSRDKNYLSVIVACIPRLHITATHQQLRFDGKYQKRWCVATNKPYSLLCLQSYQVKKSLTSCIFWALQLLGSLQILHIANPDNPETPYMTGKRLRRITALKYLSTIYPLQISEQPRHICSSGHWEGPQIPDQKNGNASESIRAHDSFTTSGLQRPNKNNISWWVPIAHVCRSPGPPGDVHPSAKGPGPGHPSPSGGPFAWHSRTTSRLAIRSWKCEGPK
jgi:hypothetical protein